MRVSSRLFRASLWLATTSLTLSGALPAFAQPAPPPGAEQSGGDNADPPSLAGRLSKITGAVSFHAAGDDHWNTASLNYPVTTGEAFWTEPQAQAEIQIADDRLVMAGSTELDVAQLTQREFVATEPQGAIFLQFTSLPDGQSVTVNTPRGAVQITAVGRYEIVAGDTNDATSVTVVDGSAHVSGNGLSLDVAAHQTATIGGSDTFQGNVTDMQQDDFLAAQLRVDTPQLATAPPQVRQQVQYMTGSADLAQYGSWNQTAEYGQVWYPRDVGSDWAPYRDGHWAYVSPWGWTWVDNARWGFAPFHYGRWVQVQDRWGWIAGAQDAPENDYPVYSPAMVSFVDVGGAVLAGAALGFAAAELSGGAPAWIPLGPREPYYPWYRARPDYFSRMNGRYGVPRDIIQRGPTYINNVNIRQTNIYINRRAATVMPAAALARGEGVRQGGRALPEAALNGARPVRGRMPVTPTAATPNLSREAAHRYNVALTNPGRAAAPGPRIAAEAPRRGAAPVLRQAALPPNVRTEQAGRVRNGGAGENGRGPVATAPGQRAPGAPDTGRGQPPSLTGGRPALRAPNAGRPATPEIGKPANQPNRNPGGPGRDQTPGNGPDRRSGPGAPANPGNPNGNRPGEQRGNGPGGSPATQPGNNPGQPRGQNVPQRTAPVPPGPGAERPGARPQQAERPRQQEHATPQGPASAPHAQPAAPRPEAQHAQPPVARPQAPRPEAPQPQAPRPQVPRPQVPRPQAPRPQAPRPEAPRPQASRPQAPRPQAPRMEAPRPQAPRPEAPRPQAPRQEAPRPQAPRPSAPPPRPQAPHPAAPPHRDGPNKG